MLRLYNFLRCLKRFFKFKTIVSFILIFQIIICSCVNSYAFLGAVPYYVIEAIASVAIANGTRLGEENKEDISKDIYENMSAEQREQFERDCRILSGSADSADYVSAEAPLVLMTFSAFASVSSAIRNYFDEKINDGTYTVETEYILSSDTVYLKQSEIFDYLKTNYGSIFNDTSLTNQVKYFTQSGYDTVNYLLCEDYANHPALVVVYGSFDKFFANCPVVVYKMGNFEGDTYDLKHGTQVQKSTVYYINEGYALSSAIVKYSSSYGSTLNIPLDSLQSAIPGKKTIHLLDDDFVGPLPTGSDFIKNLKLADGSTVQLSKDNILENENYSDELQQKLEDEGKVITTATGEKQVVLKPSATLTEESTDIFANPQLIDLTGYDEKAITADPPIQIQEPTLDTTLDTTDIFTTVSSFFSNFWQNLKLIFSTLWNWLKSIYQAITNLISKIFSLDSLSVMLENLFKRLFLIREDYLKEKFLDLLSNFKLGDDSSGDIRTNLIHSFKIREKEIPDIVFNDVVFVNNQFIRDNIDIIRELLQSFVTLLFIAGVVKGFFNSFGFVFSNANSLRGGIDK